YFLLGIFNQIDVGENSHQALADGILRPGQTTTQATETATSWLDFFHQLGGLRRSNRLFRNWSLFKCRCGRVRLNLCGISCFLCLFVLVDLVTNIFCVKIFGHFIKDRGIFLWINRLLWSRTAFFDSVIWFFLLLLFFLLLIFFYFEICILLFFHFTCTILHCRHH